MGVTCACGGICDMGGGWFNYGETKMIQDETKELINKAFCVELENAKKNYGDRYASAYEAWAVLKEEIEEVSDEYEFIRNNLLYCWNAIKSNNVKSQKEVLNNIEERAKNLIAETLQVLAVVEKYKNTLKGELK